MTREEIAEWVGCYFGLQQAGNINVPGDGATINRIRKEIDARKRAIEAKLPPGAIENWPREANTR